MNSIKQARKIFIKQIEIYQSPIKLKKPFITSLGRHDFAKNIIVVIKTNNGITDSVIDSSKAPVTITVRFDAQKMNPQIIGDAAKTALESDPEHPDPVEVTYENGQ